MRGGWNRGGTSWNKGLKTPRDNGKPGRFINGIVCARCKTGLGEHRHGDLWLCTTHYAEVIADRYIARYLKRKRAVRSVREAMGITNRKEIIGGKGMRYRMLLLQAGYEGPPRQKWGTLTGKSKGEGVHYGDEKRRNTGIGVIRGK